MKIVARIRLQHCTTKPRSAFLAKDQLEHGIARGPIRPYEVEGNSWAHIRRVLRTFDVMGFTDVRPDTVESFTEDIGAAVGRLTPIEKEIK